MGMFDESYRKSLLVLLSFVMIMLALSYAAVPFYQIFCQTTGFGGTIQRVEELTNNPETKNTDLVTSGQKKNQMDFTNIHTPDKNQVITVQFNASTSPHLP